MNFSFGGLKCKLKCPKCKGNNLWLEEDWNHNGIYFKIVDGLMPEEAEDHYQGRPEFIISKCLKCKHVWRVRGVHSVSDLAIEEDEE